MSTHYVSTAKTSLDIPTPALTVVEESYIEEELDSRTSREAVILEPTIKTVEMAANARAFLEMHFSTLFSKETPRELRRQHLEALLKASDLSVEECDRERKLWLSKETDYLRALRALKTNSERITTTSRDKKFSVASAGFEVIRVLGKGSFGVVRLVREKMDARFSGNEGLLNSSARYTEALPGSSARNIEALPNAFKSLVSGREGRRSSGSSVPKKAPCDVYAMKVIRKSEMIRNCQEGHLRAERDFLVASEKSRWIVPLVASFQDASNLYLVMEYMIGGDFLGLLIKKDRLDEKKAQFYIAEMVLCLEEAHRLKWIHRDVKPDNFLISATGHLKISDFGLAFDGHWAHDQSYYHCQRYSLLRKLGIHIDGDQADQEDMDRAYREEKNLTFYLTAKEQRARERHGRTLLDENVRDLPLLQWRNRYGRRALAKSMVGTSQYMAPEIIMGDEYDGRCDWWSLGIILYEARLPETLSFFGIFGSASST